MTNDAHYGAITSQPLVETRDASANTPWKRLPYWTTGGALDYQAVTVSSQNGHSFQFRAIPYAHGPGGKEAPVSNVVTIPVTVDKPATPMGATARTPATPNGTVTVYWGQVRTPSTHNFYRVFYWDRTTKETEATAKVTGWLSEDTLSRRLSLVKGHAYGFDVQASNLGGASARSANVGVTA